MRSAILIVFVALVAACSGQTATAPATATPPPPASSDSGQPEATPPASGDTGGTGSAVVHVEVLGGKLAGTYDGTSPKFDCNISPSGSGATFLDTTKTKGLSGLSFASAEGGAKTAKMYFQAQFGDPTAAFLQQPALEIDTLVSGSAKGHGTATLEDKGATIKWTVEGATADGTGIKASIECGPVDRR
jgi:hypothetical protein